MNTMKTSMQLALEALGEIRERLEMVEPLFPTLGTQLDIIEAQIHTMGCEPKGRESYPIDAVTPTGAKIQRVVEDFESTIHKKCQDIWALVGSVERERGSPEDLAVCLLRLMRAEEDAVVSWRSNVGPPPREPKNALMWAKMVLDEATEYHHRKQEEEQK